MLSSWVGLRPSSLATDLPDEVLLLAPVTPGPTLLELGALTRISRRVRDVEGGGLFDLVRLFDLERVDGLRLVERVRRLLEVDGGRLLDRPDLGLDPDVFDTVVR